MIVHGQKNSSIPAGYTCFVAVAGLCQLRKVYRKQEKWLSVGAFAIIVWMTSCIEGALSVYDCSYVAITVRLQPTSFLDMQPHRVVDCHRF
jgi:hypothetical protein